MSAATLFETTRLAVGPFEVADAPALFRYRSSPEVQRFQPWTPASEQELVEFIERQDLTRLDEHGGRCQLAVRLRGTGELVGDLGLHALGDGGPQVEIGYTVDPAHHGHGLATEAVGGLLGWLFEERGKHRVTASTGPDNLASIAVATRLGLRQEAHHRESYRFRGAWVDDLVFAMLGSEWRGREGRSRGLRS